MLGLPIHAVTACLGAPRRRLPWLAMVWMAPGVLFALLLLGSSRFASSPLISHTAAVPGSWRVTLRPGFVDVYQLRPAVASTAIPFFARLNSAGTVDGLWLDESPAPIPFLGVAELRGHFLQGPDGAVPFTRWTLSLRSACLLSCVLFLPAAASLRAYRRWVRTLPPQSLCSECGYDVRATPERCPECGAAVSERPALSAA